MTVSRPYHSPLREDQMELTRVRILETVASMLAEASLEEVTVASVAARAKVSVRTAYRYFPTKEDLIDAFNDWMSRQWGAPPLPTTIEDLHEMAANLLTSFERNEKLVRAARQAGSGGEIRKRRKADQMRAVSRVIAKYAPHYDEAAVRKIAAVVLNLFSSEAWLSMNDNIGLTTAESIEAVQWGIEAMVAKIDSERARKGRR